MIQWGLNYKKNVDSWSCQNIGQKITTLYVCQDQPTNSRGKVPPMFGGARTIWRANEPAMFFLVSR